MEDIEQDHDNSNQALLTENNHLPQDEMNIADSIDQQQFVLPQLVAKQDALVQEEMEIMRSVEKPSIRDSDLIEIQDKSVEEGNLMETIDPTPRQLCSNRSDNDQLFVETQEK